MAVFNINSQCECNGESGLQDKLMADGLASGAL